MPDRDVAEAPEQAVPKQEGQQAPARAPVPPMLGAALQGLGMGLLQRKLQRRLASRSVVQRKPEPEAAADEGGDEAVVEEQVAFAGTSAGAEAAPARPATRPPNGGANGGGGADQAIEAPSGEAAAEHAEFGEAGGGAAAEASDDTESSPFLGGAQANHATQGDARGTTTAPAAQAPAAATAGPSAAPAPGVGQAPAVHSPAPAGPAAKTPAQLAKDELRKFVRHGLYGPQDITPSTGLGGFQASYDPPQQLLRVTLKGGVTFTDGISTSAAGVLTANHPDLVAVVTALNTQIPNGRKRAAFVRRNYSWGKGSKQRFLQEFRDNVQATWNRPYRFHCTRPFWQSLTAGTRLKVAIHSGAKKANEHLSIETFKTAPGVNIGAAVAPGAANNPFDQHMSIGSNSTRPRTDNLLRAVVAFTPGTAALANPGIAAQLMNTYQAANPASGGQAPPIVLHAYASEPGNTKAQNRTLAQQRGQALFDAISAAATAAGINFRMGRVTIKVHDPGRSHAADRQRAELVVDGGQAQNVAAHETGHALGLLDEYAVNPGGTISGTGAATGTATGHDTIAKTIGTSGSVNENNAGIMSLGSKVQLEHYATFGEALRTVTGLPQWQIQAK